jgi:hypothetical protein
LPPESTRLDLRVRLIPAILASVNLEAARPGAFGLSTSLNRGAIVAGVVPAVPVSVQHAIVHRVPPAFAYVPTRLPVRWRYRGWDEGRETPQLFPRGRGLNIWFTTPHPSGAGFHVYADSRCSRDSGLRRFHFGRVTVAWTSVFGDDRAWRCVRTPRAMLRLSLTFIGSANPNVAVAARHAESIAKILVTVKRLHRRSVRTK